jgi:hypothetical protein
MSEHSDRPRPRPCTGLIHTSSSMCCGRGLIKAAWTAVVTSRRSARTLPSWITAKQLFEAMGAVDPASGKSRGFLLVSR